KGRYPGARKIDGIWQLPLSDLADIVDPPKEAPALPRTSGTAPSRSGRRRSVIGPRMAFIRSLGFWGRVFQALGDKGGADELLDRALDLRREGAEAWDAERAKRAAERLHNSLPAATGPTRRHGFGSDRGQLTNRSIHVA